MDQINRLTPEEVSELRRRRPGVRASFACEGIHFTAEEEALFEQFDQERLPLEERQERILAYCRAQRAAKAAAAE